LQWITLPIKLWFGTIFSSVVNGPVKKTGDGQALKSLEEIIIHSALLWHRHGI